MLSDALACVPLESQAARSACPYVGTPALPSKPETRNWTMKAVILIIDADPLTLTAVAAVLDKQGYECHCARDTEAALKAVRSLPLDLIICDVELHGQSGLELCRDLRREPNAADVPVIFVASGPLLEVLRQAHEAGGAYYLRKPFDPDVLMGIVEKALWMPHLVNAQLRCVTTAQDAVISSHRIDAGEQRVDSGLAKQRTQVRV